MSVSTELQRIQTARNTLRSKGVALGISVSTDKLDDIADAFDAIVNRGSVSATVQEGATYTIPAGYHDGTGTVSGVAGGGNYTLQSKGGTNGITPTKSKQAITPDSGYYGLSDVSIGPIPDAYQDVSSVNVAASEVLANKIFVASDGTVTAGTMPNNGAVSRTLDATSNNQTYTVPAGYHNGSGTVAIVLETKSATPTTSSQTITPTSGKVLSQVTVAAIPSEFGDTTGDDGVAANVLAGVVVHTNVNGAATQITGTMTNNGSVSKTLDATLDNQSYTVPVGYHDGTGTVAIVLETKNATPTTSSQDITPTNGKVLSKVTVAAIPVKFGDTTGDDGIAANVLSGVKVHTNVSGTATQITGTMANNGAISASIDGITTTSYFVAAGYTSGGTVSLTSDIEDALSAI